MLVRQLRIVARRQRAAAMLARPFSASDKVENTPAGQALKGATNTILGSNLIDLHHKANIGLAVAMPVAFALSPHPIASVMDYGLMVLIPVHSHVSLNLVAEDYVPRGTMRSGARMLIAVISVITGAGLLKLNVAGPGITETVKSLWRAPKSEK
eukprot:CAMPEP_0114499930 /NCGR_PEP_ID=MMETSP0109-20121206/7684_1 /TAXON_ID=29199 /ORGANISM="Chlorarachnion reptans, Strain CCCM449" /LENGTH=153 /DNA_ID=CAMNT_0001677539 /DNA_START=31 /DNA_END=492 /DNA_ORIENTATION=+